MKILDLTVENQDVYLDFHEFEGCTFKNCRLIYNGYTPVRMNNCMVTDSTQKLEGPAWNALLWLQSVYHGAGEGNQVVEKFFQDIRDNRLR